MAVAVTNTSIALYNTAGVVTANPATSSSVNGTEVFTITLAKATKDTILIMHNTGAAGAVSYSVAVGVGVFADADALTGTVADGVLTAVKLDGAYVSATGTIVITFTPYTGQKLLTDHAFTAYVIEAV